MKTEQKKRDSAGGVEREKEKMATRELFLCTICEPEFERLNGCCDVGMAHAQAFEHAK
jgi:hypothetical protein